MPRPRNSGQLDLAQVFRRVQLEMLAQLHLDRLLEHPSAAGAAAEHQWLRLFRHYLPKRYHASPAFVINAQGRRSRQIDIAIYDHLTAAPLFPHNCAIHVSIESVYAVFEVKPTISRQWLRDAGEKAASVRDLQPRRPHPSPIIAGLLATTSVWTPPTFQRNLTRALSTLPRNHQIDIGCALDQRSFEETGQRSFEETDQRSLKAINPNSCDQPAPVSLEQPASTRLILSHPDDSLMFFILRLITRLSAKEANPPPDLLKYLTAAQPSPKSKPKIDPAIAARPLSPAASAQVSTQIARQPTTSRK